VAPFLRHCCPPQLLFTVPLYHLTLHWSSCQAAHLNCSSQCHCTTSLYIDHPVKLPTLTALHSAIVPSHSTLIILSSCPPQLLCTVPLYHLTLHWSSCQATHLNSFAQCHCTISLYIDHPVKLPTSTPLHSAIVPSHSTLVILSSCPPQLLFTVPLYNFTLHWSSCQAAHLKCPSQCHRTISLYIDHPVKLPTSTPFHSAIVPSHSTLIILSSYPPQLLCTVPLYHLTLHWSSCQAAHLNCSSQCHRTISLYTGHPVKLPTSIAFHSAIVPSHSTLIILSSCPPQLLFTVPLYHLTLHWSSHKAVELNRSSQCVFAQWHVTLISTC